MRKSGKPLTEKKPIRNLSQGADRPTAPSSISTSKCRMICLDLDGTLLTDEKTISAGNRRAVRRAYESGIDIVLATGRQYRKAREFADQLGIPVTVIGNNGTSIRTTQDDSRIHFNPMPVVLREEMIGHSLDYGMTPIVHVDRYEEGIDIVIPRDLPEAISERYGLLNSEWVHVTDHWDEEVVRNAVSMVFFGSHEQVSAWHDLLAGRLLAPHVMHRMENLQKFEAMLEVLGDTGTKWYGIQMYAGAKNINPHEIMAIGDDRNDLQMLRHAGYSFAPSNAAEVVRRQAGKVLAYSNNQDAVAFAIAEVMK